LYLISGNIQYSKNLPKKLEKQPLSTRKRLFWRLRRNAIQITNDIFLRCCLSIYAGLLLCGGHMPSSVTASLRNSREMHHSAASPTRVYTTRLTVAVWPPNSHATISKRNSPMLPQLSPPPAGYSAETIAAAAKTLSIFNNYLMPNPCILEKSIKNVDN
jgi:hypothetical protein